MAKNDNSENVELRKRNDDVVLKDFEDDLKKHKKGDDEKVDDNQFELLFEGEKFIVDLPDEDTAAYLQALGLTTEEGLDQAQEFLEGLIGSENWPRFQKVYKKGAKAHMDKRKKWKRQGGADEPITMTEYNNLALEEILGLMKKLGNQKA